MSALDTEAVGRWMDAELGIEGPVSATKFDTGQSNPTYRLETPSGAYVLRRKPPGTLLKSAHAVDREFRVQMALAGSEVPVARMLGLCADDSVIGSMFYVMEHVPGRTLDDPSLPGETPAARAAIIDEMNRVLAAIHEVDLEATGLSDYGPPGNYYRRQLDRWSRQYRASETEEQPALDALMAWLDTEMPADDGQRGLVHGDYRIDNMLFAADGPDCRAVLDWELSTLGHPCADLAGVIMQWQMPPGPEGRGLAGIDRAVLGLPSDREFVAAYCARRGLAGIPRFGYFVAFAFFRMAAILQGVKKRALDGNASNPEKGLKLGAYVPQFAEAGMAWTERQDTWTRD
ncbi:MAG: phosphotransferase family protein [Paracoccaceae bacterium]